jgi:hypothetical protein
LTLAQKPPFAGYGMWSASRCCNLQYKTPMIRTFITKLTNDSKNTNWRRAALLVRVRTAIANAHDPDIPFSVCDYTHSQITNSGS